MKGQGLPPFEQDLSWRGSFGEKERKNILQGDFEPNLAMKEMDRRLKESRADDFFCRITYLYLKQYLMDDILVKVDRSSMAFGQEVRAPLLDYRLVEYAANLPADLKFRNLSGKYILKKLMAGRLPKEILSREKQGFGVPVSKWLREDLKPLADKYFSRDYLQRQGIFNPAGVRDIYEKHLAKKDDFRKELWTLLIFQMWHDRWMK